MLTGKEILRQMEMGTISITPFDPSRVGPNSADLHLGTTLRRYERGVLDAAGPNPTVPVPLGRNGGWLLEPGTLYLGTTLEYTETRGFVPRIDGRSSFGRLGVFCHITAGLGDNGFRGEWTLELTCVQPVIIYPKGRYLQIFYTPVQGEQTFYGETGNDSGRYQDQSGPQGSRIEE